MADGLEVGLLADGLSKPAVGNQEYEKPLTAVSPICLPLALVVQVFVKSSPALTVTGALFTVTTTWSVLLQPVAVLVLVTV